MSDHFDGKLFFNPVDQKTKSLWAVLKWKWTTTAKTWPEAVRNEATPTLPKKLNVGEFALTFVNHSTFLVQIQTEKKLVNILTDPIFSQRTSPVQFAGPKRVRPPGIRLEDLPTIDLVLVSHNHYDHMDRDSLERLNQAFSPVFVTPLGNAKYFNFSKQANVQEKDWNEFLNFTDLDLKVHVLRSHHWSRRTLTDTNKALWCSFMIESKSNTIYFAGDTGYKDHFKQIKSNFPKISLALLPIGAYEPRWFMQDSHMNPEDAVKAHLDLSPLRSIGMHFGTFQLTDEGLDDPLIDLEKATQAARVTNFLVLKEGQTIAFSD